MPLHGRPDISTVQSRTVARIPNRCRDREGHINRCQARNVIRWVCWVRSVIALDLEIQDAWLFTIRQNFRLVQIQSNWRQDWTIPSVYTHFNTLKKKSLRKTLCKKVKLLKMSNFTFLHNVFYTIFILDPLIATFQLSFLEFGTASK